MGGGGEALRQLDLNIRRANKMSANQRNGSLSSFLKKKINGFSAAKKYTD